MKLLILLIVAAIFVTSCRSSSRISKTEAAGLDTITNINQLETKKKAIYKNAKGEHRLMRYEPDPKDSTEENDSLRLINSGGGANIRSFIVLAVNKRCDSDNFDGSNRADAKISISPSTLQSYSTIRSLAGTLPGKDLMVDSISGTNMPRIPSENRNVTIKKAYLYAYSRQTDEDFHVIIGTTKKASATTRYFNVEISGLPPAGHPSFDILNAVRNAFFLEATDNLCASGYFFYINPLKIEVSGSLFFDRQHANGLIGPASARPPDAWEIHPVTSLVFK
jgi:hypothetical protein